MVSDRFGQGGADRHFGHAEVVIGHGRHDRLVCHAQNLVILAEMMELLGDRLGHSPGNPRINFIKNRRLYLAHLGKTSFKRQQKAAHFPTGSRFAQGLQGFSGVRAEGVGNSIEPGRRRGNPPKLHSKLHPLHGQGNQFRHQLRFQIPRGPATQLMQAIALGFEGLIGRLVLVLQGLQGLPPVRQLRHPLLQLIAPRNQRTQVEVIFPAEGLELHDSPLHPLQPIGIAFQAGSVGVDLQPRLRDLGEGAGHHLQNGFYLSIEPGRSLQ